MISASSATHAQAVIYEFEQQYIEAYLFLVLFAGSRLDGMLHLAPESIFRTEGAKREVSPLLVTE